MHLIVENQTSYRFVFRLLFEKTLILLQQRFNLSHDFEVNLIIVDNKTISIYNQKHRLKNGPTDVLSFGNDFKSLRKLLGYDMLGDIFISYERVLEQAKNYGHSRKREWLYLFVHAMLHLLGHDHTNKNDEIVMNGIASELMQRMGVNR